MFRLYYVHNIILLPVAKFCILHLRSLFKNKILPIITFVEVFTNSFAFFVFYSQAEHMRIVWQLRRGKSINKNNIRCGLQIICFNCFNYLTSVCLLYRIAVLLKKISSATFVRMFFVFSETVITTVLIVKHKRWY